MVVLMISGMRCRNCANAVTRALLRVRGVIKARVDVASGCVTVTGAARAKDLIGAIEAEGYRGQLA